jgi:hypothetical protein
MYVNLYVYKKPQKPGNSLIIIDRYMKHSLGAINKSNGKSTYESLKGFHDDSFPTRWPGYSPFVVMILAVQLRGLFILPYWMKWYMYM